MYINICLRIALVFVLSSTLLGCVESSFELAKESKLPNWFDVPEGLKRDNLRVTLDYYTDGNAVFTLLRKDSNSILQEVNGLTQGYGPFRPKKPAPGYPKHYPMYQIVTVGTTTEVIEHRRMEPIFYVSDDPDILKKLTGPNAKFQQDKAP